LKWVVSYGPSAAFLAALGRPGPGASVGLPASQTAIASATIAAITTSPRLAPGSARTALASSSTCLLPRSPSHAHSRAIVASVAQARCNLEGGEHALRLDHRLRGPPGQGEQ